MPISNLALEFIKRITTRNKPVKPGMDLAKSLWGKDYKIAKISYTMPCEYHGYEHVLDVHVPYWPDKPAGMVLVQDYLDDLVSDDSVGIIITEYDAQLPEGSALFV